MEQFSDDFRAGPHNLLKWRCNMRHFKSDRIAPGIFQPCLQSFVLAPSADLSEPWQAWPIALAQAPVTALQHFRAFNVQALEGYNGEQARLRASLKLFGMHDAPERPVMFCKVSADKGRLPGATSVPETRRYSVAGVLNLLWLTARAHTLGLGWLSDLDPDWLGRDLGAPLQGTFVAYLCLGWRKQIPHTQALET